MIDIRGIDKARLLASLYNRARPQGIGHLVASDVTMLIDQARSLLETRTSFDYIQGRVLKIDLSSSVELDPRLYDRDNGHGAAQEVVDALKKYR